jgi:putative ABC transport system ATP-binding protein
MEPAFVLRDVVVERGGVRALDGVSASFAGGRTTGVAGPSGSGKTTMLRLCNRLEVPDSGTVLYHGRDVSTLDPLELRRRVGMVFQRPTLLGGTVLDELRVAEPHATLEECTGVLQRVSLAAAFLDRHGGELSGGEAQRVCLARTLLTSPEVLLLDEPTSALDAAPRLAFESLVGHLVDEGLTAVWVTHDMAQLRRVADDVVVLDGGRVAYAGSPDGLETGGNDAHG